MSSSAVVRVAEGEPLFTAPPKPGDHGTAISIATWNIRDGRKGGLESAVRSFFSLGVDIGIVQETTYCRAIIATR